MKAFVRIIMKTVTVFMLTSAVSISSVAEPASIYDFTMKSIEGKDIPLKDFSGKVVMIVNVASKCGLTPQYDDLQKLYETYGDKGFVILGFPANNFAGQEPGTNEEIRQFCRINYGVTFPMFGKISVKGDDIDELYAYLTTTANESFVGEIKWNFTKFLVDENGNVINRFEPKTKPTEQNVIDAIEAALNGK